MELVLVSQHLSDLLAARRHARGAGRHGVRHRRRATGWLDRQLGPARLALVVAAAADDARAKPVAVSSVDATGDSPKEQVLPATPVEPTPDDFPQFLGPNRDGHLPRVLLAHDWQTTPPRILWQKEIGSGWSGFSVVGDYAVTLEQYGDDEFVTCRELATGDTRWSHAEKARHDDPQGGSGPRSTPTIHDSKVYTLGATGILCCLHLSNGELIWRKDLRKEFGISDAEELQGVMWGRAASPLIYGELCIVPAGGKPHVSLVAYDTLSGDKKWTGGAHQISYASPAVLTLCGKEQIVSVNESNLTGHDPQTGNELWSYDWPGHSNGMHHRAGVRPGEEVAGPSPSTPGAAGPRRLRTGRRVPDRNGLEAAPLAANQVHQCGAG